MPTAFAIRQTIEAALAERFPSALTPAPRTQRPVSETGIPPVDEALSGGLPMGALTEVAGPECSGRTGLALSFLARLTMAGRVCAWVDVTDCLQPESAAAAGVDLSRLLWVRCGASQPSRMPQASNRFQLPRSCFVPPPAMKGLHGGGFGPHPRTETKGLSQDIPGFFSGSPHAGPRQHAGSAKGTGAAPVRKIQAATGKPAASARPWARMDQALRVTDLLLQAGGFSAIVLDMGSIAPECITRVPLSTWFRYRAAAERTQAGILLLTQHPCAKSSAGLSLRLRAGIALDEEATVFSGIRYSLAVEHERFAHAALKRKPPQSEKAAEWRSRSPWCAQAKGAGRR